MTELRPRASLTFICVQSKNEGRLPMYPRKPLLWELSPEHKNVPCLRADPQRTPLIQATEIQDFPKLNVLNSASSPKENTWGVKINYFKFLPSVPPLVI